MLYYLNFSALPILHPPTLHDWLIRFPKHPTVIMVKILPAISERLLETLSALLCPQNLWSWNTPSNSFRKLTAEIDEIEVAVKRIMNKEFHSPILTIPGINYRMGVMFIAKIGDFSRFDSTDKILAYAGMSPSTYAIDNGFFRLVLSTPLSCFQYCNSYYQLLYNKLIFTFPCKMKEVLA